MERPIHSPPPRLTGHQTRVFTALAETTFPSQSALTVPVDSDDLHERLCAIFESMPPLTRFGVGLFVVVFNWCALLRYGRTFVALPTQKRTLWVNGWVESKLATRRFIARALLTLIKPTHIGRRAVQAEMNYPVDRLRLIEPNPKMTLDSQRHRTTISRDEVIQTQVVIVGTGAGGAPLACELAEKGVDVVLLESGRWHDPGEFGEDPARHLKDMYIDNGTTVALGRPGVPIPLGRTVGGSTTINSGTCFRTPDRIFSDWATRGLSIDAGHIDAAYKRVEERLSVQPLEAHLLGGSSHVIAKGSDILGLKHGPLKRNVKDCQRSAVCAFGCPSNAKQSTNISYVPWALTAGAQLYSRVVADRLIIRNGRACGVTARHLDTGHTLTVEAETVVSACGTIGGVSFLGKNGIKNRHLGRHMSIHPGTKITALMDQAVHGWDDTPQGYGIYELFDEGIMFEGAFVPPEYASIAFPFAGHDLTRILARYDDLAIFGLLVSDEPNGRVRIGPGGHPIITYWMSQRDTDKMARGLRMLAEVFFAAGAEEIFLPIAGAEKQNNIDGALAALKGPIDPWRLEAAAFHPLGTCRMGQSSKNGVINEALETYEIPGLFVVDGSIFPSSLGVNPQMTIMAYATMAADRLAAQF